MDLSGTSDDLPALYGYTEMYEIAAHFSMDPEDLHLQWQDQGLNLRKYFRGQVGP